MNHKNFLYSFIIIIATASVSFGQDVSFSQFFSNQLYLNPAYAGNPKHQRASINYRNQWLTRQSPYMSYGASFDTFFIEQKSGFGINIINDMQALGTLNWLTLDVMYSYNLRVAYNAQIRGGIQAGGIFKSTNTRNLVFPDMVDEMGNPTSSVDYSGSSKVMPDFAVGFLGEWDIFYGGFAVHHLLEPNTMTQGHYSSKLPRKYTAHIGCDINIYKRYILRKSLVLSPNIIYQKQSNYQQLNVGLYLSHQNLSTGIWVKNNLGIENYTFVFIAGYHNAKHSFAYSYDFSVLKGGFRGLNTSSHEVTFGMNFKYKKWSRKKIHTIKSPLF
ncbi:MAG: PorP/SprF family type IX secretion system membrane protein [Bacteroidales bacterium]|jgi:type IX secretion system PorP/SprF family membrane protein|nr:PorP/SprF family type IX secretion system membrane protein [Bacteroidales bacterium]MDD4672139.1 PorP/SprF family type IX secretion system membrane protein [Bacteroidales bacterium]MDY0348415.1 PorP/SprF family type IX secretion system membrane protein [Tenuifilaceae bacterium]